MVVTGVLSVLLAVSAWLLIPNDRTAPEGKKGVAALAVHLSPESLKLMFRGFGTLGFIAAASWFFGTGGTRNAFQSLWGGRFFTHALLYSPDESSLFLTVLSLGCLVGALSFGTLSDRFGCFPLLFVTGAGIGGIFLLYLVPAVSASPVCLSVLSFLLGLFGSGGYTAGFAAMKFFTDPERNGIATGIMNCCGFVGCAIFMQASGVLMEGIGGDIAGQFRVLLILYAVLAIVTGTASCFLNRDKFRER